MDHTQGLPVERLGAAQQRRLFIERLAAIRAERRRDAQHIIFNECIGRRVPGGVAARLKRCAQAAGREAGRIRLAADELLAGELHDHLTAAAGRDETVVLLGGDAGHRLEPVREVRGAFFDRPVFHGIGHDTRGIVIETLALFHRRLHLPVRFLRQTLAHDCIVKYHGSKNVRDLFHLAWSPFCISKIGVNNKKRHWCPEILSSPRRHCRFNVAKYTPVAEKCQAGRAQFLSADFTEFSANLLVFLSLTRANAVVYYIHGF